MMMNLYRPNNRQNGAPLLGAFAVVVCALAVVFGFDVLSGGVVREYARGAAGAARSLAASASASITTSGFFSSKAALARENEDLRRALALQTEHSMLAEHLRDENSALHEMARLAQQTDGITARVISSLHNSPYGTFLIDAGTRRGVREGAHVLTEGGFFLGTVTSVSSDSATVQSLFAPGAQIDMTAGDTAFTAEGRGGGNAHASVPRESLVATGDTTIASEFNRPAGEILHIESASSSATAFLSIRIPINVDTLRFVYVVSQ